MARRYYIVDVFAERKYAGNQLAVVVDAEGLSTAEMQSIAREMNFSETTFLGSKEPRDGGFDVRIFTPTEEIPFAGHPTLGTGYVLRREIAALTTAAEVRLNLGVGQVPVTFATTVSGDVAWMSPPTPKLGKTQSPDVAAALLRISPGDVDTRYPAQEASVGISFLLVPLRSRKALAAMQLDPERRAELQRPEERTTGIFAFCAEPRQEANHLAARMQFEAVGVREDPATGSAGACLAAYLAHHRYFSKSEVDARVEQGYEIGRPSLLLLRAEACRDELSVHVGGSVVLVARGELI